MLSTKDSNKTTSVAAILHIEGSKKYKCIKYYYVLFTEDSSGLTW